MAKLGVDFTNVKALKDMKFSQSSNCSVDDNINCSLPESRKINIFENPLLKFHWCNLAIFLWNCHCLALHFATCNLFILCLQSVQCVRLAMLSITLLETCPM